MTLQCECGGALELIGQSYSEKSASERYRCASCKRTGTYRFDSDGDTTSGCVTVTV